MRRVGRRGQKKDSEAKHISSLFAVYKKRLRAPEKSVVVEVVSVVNDVTGLTIRESSCRYNTHTKTVSLQVSGMVRDRIRCVTPEILSRLEARLGKQNAPHTIL